MDFSHKPIFPRYNVTNFCPRKKTLKALFINSQKKQKTLYLWKSNKSNTNNLMILFRSVSVNKDSNHREYNIRQPHCKQRIHISIGSKYG